MPVTRSTSGSSRTATTGSEATSTSRGTSSSSAETTERSEESNSATDSRSPQRAVTGEGVETTSSGMEAGAESAVGSNNRPGAGAGKEPVQPAPGEGAEVPLRTLMNIDRASSESCTAANVASLAAPSTAREVSMGAPTLTRPTSCGTVVRRKGSKASTSKSEKVKKAKLELLKLQVQLAEARLAAAVEDESDNEIDDSASDENEGTDRVSDWLYLNIPPAENRIEACNGASQEKPLPPNPVTSSQQERSRHAPKGETEEAKNGIAELASAITLAVRSSQATRHSVELPVYNGAYQDWLTFKTAYEESAHQFSEHENTSRLRRCLKGRAKEAVESMLYTGARAEEILKSLESRFGRPDTIAITELERLRGLSKLSETPKDLCIFANRVNNIVSTLRALDKTRYLYNPEATRTTIEKLPPSLRYQWFEYAATNKLKDEPDLLMLTRFLNRMAEYASPFAQPESVHHDGNTATQSKRTNRTFHTTEKENEKTVKCPICEANTHAPSECEKFKKEKTDSKWQLAKQYNLCYRCLVVRSKNHKCPVVKCNVEKCERSHHSLLHKKQETETVASTWTEVGRAYLKILPVNISGPAGEVNTYALLDDGSTITLVDDKIADTIGAPGPVLPLRIEAIGDTKIAADRSRRVKLTMKGTADTYKINARTVSELNLSSQQVLPSDIEQCSHLVDLRDEITYSRVKPTILIGQDNWHLLMATQTKIGKENQPIASLTPLGWVLRGAQTRTLGRGVSVNHVTCDESMDRRLQEYFTNEASNLEAKLPTTDTNRMGLEILERHTKRGNDGHYETSLLWKDESVQMPDNYDTALRRLFNIEKKIDKCESTKEKYNQQMQQFIDKGYAEKAPSVKNNNKLWYLPHFAVTNPMKPDKMRIVHDAAAKTRGKSLNDYLLTGPGLLKSLPGVLMRFRQHRVAVTADVREMFMQVKVREEDRDALRFLWRGNRRTGDPEEYRMSSLIFGANCSPSTAIYVKNINAERYRDTFPEASRAIIDNHYVDDYLQSFNTEEEAINIAGKVKEIQNEAHFELRKWTSNSRDVLRVLGDEDSLQSPNTQLTEKENNSERVLGMVWKMDTDEITFNLNLNRLPSGALESILPPTKRQLLQVMMSLYDPLGFASPVTSRCKQLMQEVWRRGTSWDTEVEPDLAVQWAEWLGHLRALADVGVPRSYLAYSETDDLQLHVFCDASEQAYAAALYWRMVSPDGTITTALVCAKAKVAPLKLTSIPRLELQAAVMGARMAATVKEEHDKQPSSTIYWTDSRTVLSWLKAGARAYKPYVAHRVAAIEELSSVNSWRWVPTKMNVADDATRGVPEQFNTTHRWFTGPSFLKDSSNSWPVEKVSVIDSTGEEKVNTVTYSEETVTSVVPNSNRFSKWEKFVRATARVLQFIDLCRLRKDSVNKLKISSKNSNKNIKCATQINKNKKFVKYSEIDTKYINSAERLIINKSQIISFSEEISALKLNKQFKRESKLRTVAVVLRDDLLYMRSRIDNASFVNSEVKSPIILDGNNNITQLWIDYTHRQLGHANCETTVNECKQHYYVVRLRPSVKKVINKCQVCRLRKAVPSRPPTGDHPMTRLAHHRRPFSFVGLDYFGPYNVAIGRRREKRWVALFTCLTSRAVHLEVAGSLSADSAIMALRRMVARRGCPTEVWSDNGTNFHGAERILREAATAAVESEAADKGIRWRFIPPSAPFMGGAWERMVKAVKNTLNITMKERVPTEEVLTTLLAEAEYIVNSRPLTHVSVAPDDPEALTPNHFLLGGSARVPVPGEFTEADQSNKSWRTSQRLADQFWSRWVREYLPELQHRREPQGPNKDIQTGDLVLIADGNLPRNTWPRGIVKSTYPGADGRVRVVDVETQGGVMRRPVKKLVKLPVEAVLPEQ